MSYIRNNLLKNEKIVLFDPHALDCIFPAGTFINIYPGFSNFFTDFISRCLAIYQYPFRFDSDFSRY